jgi:hypothetical protein
MARGGQGEAAAAAGEGSGFGPFHFLGSVLNVQLCLFAAILAVTNFYGLVELINRTANSRWTYIPDAAAQFSAPVQQFMKQLSQQIITLVGKPGMVKLGFKDIVLVAILFAIVYFKSSHRK